MSKTYKVCRLFTLKQKIGGPCLDIGCGDGELAINIAKHKITGIELSLEQIKAKEKNSYKNLNFIIDILNYKSRFKI